ncbi:MAG: Wzz/FepE/Etk N-terminal domain-containing protein [Chloroflexota bacterium]
MQNNTNFQFYDDEIDLRIYVRQLIKNWMWIVLPAFLAGGLIFLYFTLQPNSYQATALVSISAPSLDFVFDDRILTDSNNVVSPQNNDLTNLALSDAVMLDLFEEIQDLLPIDISTYTELAEHLEATTETRSEIVTLQGSFSDPQLSATVVNTWSQIFVGEANKFFEGEIETSQTFFLQQLDDAQLERDQMNADWAAFQAQNNKDQIAAELTAQKELQQSYINRFNSLELLKYDIQGLKTQLAENPNSDNVLTDLTLSVLQNRAFGTSGNLQFEVSSFDALSSSTLEERVEQLDSLELASASQQAELSSRIEAIGPTILALQEQLTLLQTEEAQLRVEREIILNTYDTLARKVAEGEIEQNDTTGQAQVAARAIVPVEAEPRGRVTSSVIAIVVMALFATVTILALAWWNEESSPEASTLQNN